jgi:FtsP/CotA-like multicopper oxidase with cupredoxin domain
LITRRDIVLSGAWGLAGCAVLAPFARHSARLDETRIGGRDIVLTAQERRCALGSATMPLWLYGERPFPVLRMSKGEALSVTLRNALGEHSSIHWHGVRGPNAMDGVPYLTQLPVQPGEEFVYRFTPPDAGTFFFHPHCNTATQMGRGLLGALIVDDPDETWSDDVVLLLKDWCVDGRGGFLPFLTDSGASRAGTFGALRTVNGLAEPTIDTRARTNLRVRLINADSSRIAEIGIAGAAARVVAIDGNAVTPFALETWRLGPGMRLDLALDMHDADARVLDYFSASPILLATLRAHGSGSGAGVSLPAVVQPADFTGAWRHALQLEAAVAPNVLPAPEPVVLSDGRRIDIADSLCLAAGTFWTLDGQSWPGRDHSRLPPPLFSLARGQNVVLDIENATSRAHPIHVHGHTMTLLSASLLARPVHRADTVLVLPNERVTVGFTADNPGNWMIHCHVIEHQETGMMGWFRVS